MEEIDLNNTYWDRIKGYVSELRIDARWILRQNESLKPLGSLRIVSHPDLPPGHLRAYFTYVTSIRKKSKEEKIKTIENYQMDIKELEVYSVDNDVKTETVEHVDLYQELEKTYGIEIVEKKK